MIASFLGLFLCFQSLAFAQDLPAVQDLSKQLATSTLQNCTQNAEACKTVPGAVIETLLKKDLDSDPLKKNCPPKKNKKTNDKKNDSQIVAVFEMQTGPKVLEDAPRAMFIDQNQIEYEKKYTLPAASAPSDWGKSLFQWSKNASTHYVQEKDPRMQQALFAAGLVEYAAKSNLNENEMATQMAKAIEDYAALSNQASDKLGLLASLGRRMNLVYNDKRNPFQNKKREPIPAGTIPLPDLMRATSDFNDDQSGVCTDQASAIALIAQKIYPNEDVVVISNGTHFAVAASDGKKTFQILNSGDQSKSNELNISPALPTTNTRISQMKDGKLQEIAIMSTETGALLQKFYSNNVSPLKTGIDPSVFYVDFKNGNKNTKMGAGRTSNSELLVLVAEKQGDFLGMQSTTDYGLALQKMNTSGTPGNIIVTFHQSLQKNLIHYVSSDVTVNASSGVVLDVSKGFKLSDADHKSTDIPPLSGDIRLVQKASVETHPKNPGGPQFKADADIVHSIGNGDWRETQGKVSRPGLQGLMGYFSNTNLHLQQIDANASFQTTLRSGMISKTEAQYLGSNVGQKIRVTEQIEFPEVKAPSGFKIFALYVGYQNSDLPGFKTKKSFLNEASGGLAGMKLETKKGAQFSTEIQGIGSGDASRGNFKASFPLFNRKKK